MPVWAFCQIFKCLAHGKKSYWLRLCVNQWFKPMSSYPLLKRLSALPLCHSRVFPSEFYYLPDKFSNVTSLSPVSTLFNLRFSGNILQNLTFWVLEILAQVIFFLLVRLPGYSDVPLSPFQFRNPKLSSMGFCKIIWLFKPPLNL